MTYVEARFDTDEYAAEIETGDDGQAEVVVWTATGEGLPAPTLPLDVVMDGEVGDEVLPVGLPVLRELRIPLDRDPRAEEPADDPAVLLTLSAPDVARGGCPGGSGQ